MHMRSRVVRGVTTLLMTLVIGACGGTTLIDDPSGATGGVTSMGGAPSTGARPALMGGAPLTGGRAGLAGGSPAIGGGSACCLALPVCDFGDAQMSNGAACPAGGQCYTRQLCCSQIQCLRTTYSVQDASTGSGGQCNAYPSCPVGEIRVTGACPMDYLCYADTLCGITILCGFSTSGGPDSGAYDAGLDDAGDAAACNPATEYNRDYMGLGLNECMNIRFTCPSGTYYFNNSCGCGCEQNPNCPAYVDCSVTPSSPLCASSACPFTLRV
jgi:hypothetical protein